ncbi:putative sugar transporter [Hamiltosporidium magnivora]|uniref:Putative sugar transporter n=1 Tax=Hamiltosporidium magnivora TaxID=148818 RepID=A0A4V2JWU7_9MICR|nr:putative sugar transporter [Hamiltosporidium magnivora]
MEKEKNLNIFRRWFLDTNAAIQFSAIIAALCAFSIGLNMSILDSAAAIFMECSEEDSNLKRCVQCTKNEWSFFVSILSLGAPFAIYLSKYTSLSKKKFLLIANALYIIGFSIIAFTYNYLSVVLGRFIVGCGVGLCSVNVPLYISYLSKNKLIINYNQLFIIVGIFSGQVLSFGFTNVDNWKIRLYINLMFLLCHTFLLLLIKNVEFSVESTKKSIFSIFTSKEGRKAIFPALSIHIGRQLSCVNNVIQYSTMLIASSLSPAQIVLSIISLSSFILGINLTNINTAKQVFSTCSTQNTIIKSCILTTTSQWAFLIALLSLGAPITALFHTTLFKYFYILISKHIYPNPSSYINKNKENSSIDINRDRYDRYDRYDRFDITNDNTNITNDNNTTTTNNTNTNPTTLHILLLANLLYITSTLLFTTCTSYTILCISRIITGMAVGLTSISVPSFLTNTSKFIKNYHQIFIILGIFFGQIFSFIFYTLETWKIPFYILFLVIILHSTLLYFKKIEISEYESIGECDSKCVSIVNTVDLYPNPSLTLNKCINNKDTKKDCNNSSDNNNCNNCDSNNCDTNNHSNNRDCNNCDTNDHSNNNTITNTTSNNTTPNNTITTNTGNTLVISLLTHILQQLSCINGVIQYTSLLISNNIPYTLLIITINITMIIFTLISILLKMERKKIFLISNLLTLVGLIMLSSSLNVLISLFVYLIGFTIGLGPIPWQLVGGNSKVGDSVNESVDCYKGVNDKDMVVGVNNSVDNYKGVIKSVDGYKGVNESIDNYKGVIKSVDGYKGVNESIDGYKGVNDSVHGYKGVNDSKDSYEGVNNSKDSYKGVNNSKDNCKGVNDSVNGYNPVNNSIDNYNPVNNSTNEQHPFNNLSDNYHPVNNSILTQHPFKNTLNTYNPVNTKTKCYSNTVIAKTCVTVNWLTCFIFSYIFPITHDYMGKRCYLLYACICSVIYTYIYIKGDNVI